MTLGLGWTLNFQTSLPRLQHRNSRLNWGSPSNLINRLLTPLFSEPLEIQNISFLGLKKPQTLSPMSRFFYGRATIGNPSTYILLSCIMYLSYIPSWMRNNSLSLLAVLYHRGTLFAKFSAYFFCGWVRELTLNQDLRQSLTAESNFWLHLNGILMDLTCFLTKW